MNTNNNMSDLMRRIKEMKEAKNNAVNNTQQFVKKAMPATPAQKAMYLRLCAEKGQEVNQFFNSWTGERGGQMDNEIKRLLKMPKIIRPTEGQVQFIKDICERNAWEVPDLNGYTGGREGTIKGLIDDLLELERETIRSGACTDSQRETLERMYYCPDINLALLDERFDINFTGEIVNGIPQWTMVNIDEYTALLSEITYKQASDFINLYQVEFYTWLNTRPSEGKMRMINSLREKNGMRALAEQELYFLDKKMADAMIERLQLELKDSNLVHQPLAKAVWIGSTLYTGEDVFEANFGRGRGVHKDPVDRANQALESVFNVLFASIGQSGREDSHLSYDMSNTDEQLKDLVGVCIEINGVESVVNSLSNFYDDNAIMELVAEYI